MSSSLHSMQYVHYLGSPTKKLQIKHKLNAAHCRSIIFTLEMLQLLTRAVSWQQIRNGGLLHTSDWESKAAHISVRLNTFRCIVLVLLVIIFFGIIYIKLDYALLWTDYKIYIIIRGVICRPRVHLEYMQMFSQRFYSSALEKVVGYSLVMIIVTVFGKRYLGLSN